MSLAQLEKVIRQAAATQTKAIAREQAGEIEQAHNKLTQQARLLEERVMDQAQINALQQSKLIHQSSRLTARAEVLGAKQAELEAVFTAALEAALQWPAEKNHAFIAALLKALPSEAGVITAGDAHHEVVRALAPTPLYKVASKTIPHEGGFRYENKRVVIDMRVSALLGALLREKRSVIARTLFS